MPKDNGVLLAAVVAVEGAHAFSAFLPSTFTIRELARKSPQGLAHLRAGYIPALIFNAALALTVSALTESSYPLIFGLVTATSMIIMYEWAIRGGEKNLELS